MTPLEHATDALNAQQAEPLIMAKCRALLAGYHARWKDADYQTIEVERTLTGPIINPATGRGARKFRQAGKLDVIAQRDGRLVLIDHKTCSTDIADPDAPFWRQLVVDSQVSHYMLLAWLNGLKCDDAVWDVIRKPSIAPKKLAKALRIHTVVSRQYCGRHISDASLAQLQIDERETPEMYEARLAEDCTHVRPEWYFQRRSVPRLDAELLDYASELWMHSKDLLHERKRDLPVRNPGACMLYGTPCQFLGVCSGHDEITSDRWKQKERLHPELDIDDGSDVLTHSRIRTFQVCRRKHYYQFDLGVERVDVEDREALLIGTLIHVGLEAWFLSFLETDNGNDKRSPASEAGKQSAEAIPF